MHPKVKEGKCVRGYHCIFCSKVLKNQQAHKRHLQAHNNENPYFCKFCSKELASQKALSCHEKLSCHLVSAEPPRFKCDKCPKLFQTKQYLQMHGVVHGNEFKHVCDTCGKAFKWKNALTGHVQRIHEKKTRFTCSFCPRKFLFVDEFKTHLRTHTGEKTYKCSTCSKTFLQKSNLRCHEVTHMNIPVEDWLPCPHCEKRFKSKNYLKNHLRTHSSSNLECSVCQKIFKNSKGLQRHIKSHAIENNSKCSICNKIFANDSSRKRHENVHFAKQYKCSTCCQEFHRRESLQSHVKYHHEREKWMLQSSCLFCGKLCTGKSNLSVHLLLCLKERPYICKLCGFEFTSPGSLKRHLHKLH